MLNKIATNIIKKENKSKRVKGEYKNMKKTRQNITHKILIILIIIIIILTGIIIKLSKKNNIINKQEESKGQQLKETLLNSSYITVEEHFKEMQDKSNTSFDNLTLLYNDTKSHSLTSAGKCNAAISYTFDSDYSQILMSAVGLCAASGNAPTVYEAALSTCTINLSEGEYKKINNSIYVLKNVKKGDTISISRSYTVTSWWTTCRVDFSLYIL